MRPWNATHWKLGPSLWAKGPLKTMRMSAMLYTHTAEPLNTELRKWDAYFQWKPTMGTFTHNLKTHPGKIFCSCLLRPLFLRMCRLHRPGTVQRGSTWWLDVYWLSHLKPHYLSHRRGFVEDGGKCKDRNNTELRDLALAMFFEPGSTTVDCHSHCGSTTQTQIRDQNR